jgi:hypothetical protein
MTGLDYTRLALLRSLWLQRETRRTVRTRQREAAALLARTSMETCILGLWYLHHPDAANKLRLSEIKTVPAMLSFLSSTGLIPDAVIRQAVRELSEPEKPTVLTSEQGMPSYAGNALDGTLTSRGRRQLPPRATRVHAGDPAAPRLIQPVAFPVDPAAAQPGNIA